MGLEKFDIAIIGAGPGGYTAAIRAAQIGFKVALIEKRFLGGVCLNVGCIPTKAILSSADILDKVKKANLFGIHLQNISFDLNEIIQRKDKITENLRKSLTNLLAANKIQIFHDEAKFLNTKTLYLKNKNETLESKNIIIATGSRPKELENIEVDHKQIYNSNSILDLKTLPKSLTIIGGGYIGCEFASFFSRLGVRVTIIEAMPSILFTHSKEVVEFLTKTFIRSGINIKTSIKVKNITKSTDKVSVELENNEIIDSEKVLLSVGRIPNTKFLDLEKTNIILGKKNEIIVDEKMRTNVSNIFAIGDVIRKYMLAHTASCEALVAIDTIKGLKNKMNYKAVPAIIFTKPEIATVGITEETAKEKNIDLEIGKFPFIASGKAITSDEKEGFVKVLFDKKTKIILGAQAIGFSASVLIAEMSLAITNKLKASSIIETIHAHPTLSESWHEATLISQNRPLNFPPNF